MRAEQFTKLKETNLTEAGIALSGEVAKKRPTTPYQPKPHSLRVAQNIHLSPTPTSDEMAGQ